MSACIHAYLIRMYRCNSGKRQTKGQRLYDDTFRIFDFWLYSYQYEMEEVLLNINDWLVGELFRDNHEETSFCDIIKMQMHSWTSKKINVVNLI